VINDPHYPSVDISFLLDHAKKSGKLAEKGIVKIGATTTFVLEGPQPIFKRTISIRELKPQDITLEQATAVAFKLSFLSQLLQWLEQNKQWKDGAYIVPENK